MPAQVPVFPLRGVILLPRSTLPLNVFEPRYLSLVDDALSGNRLIGVVQPDAAAGESESPEGRDVPLRRTGCVGRLTAFQETDDNRVLISLIGIARFEITGEAGTDRPYRICSVAYDRFHDDFVRGTGEEAVDRERLLAALKAYLSANKLSADWDSIDRSPNELLVNTLSMISPYGPEEKQALLEAESLARRAEVLVALAEMELAASDSESGSTIQ
jgi:Lon protease-like protein